MKRRDLLGMGGMTLVGATLLPASVRAQTPKRGGTIALRLWDPPHFDPYLQVSYKTHIVYSFTHSRLVKHKVGPAVVPGTFAIEGDGSSRTRPRTSSSSVGACAGSRSRR